MNDEANPDVSSDVAPPDATVKIQNTSGMEENAVKNGHLNDTQKTLYSVAQQTFDGSALVRNISSSHRELCLNCCHMQMMAMAGLTCKLWPWRRRLNPSLMTLVDRLTMLDRKVGRQRGSATPQQKVQLRNRCQSKQGRQQGNYLPIHVQTRHRW